MTEYQLIVFTAPGRGVPVRITNLLLPSDIEVVGMQFGLFGKADCRWVQLTVVVPTKQRLELLTKRLNRLADVYKVVVLGPGSHRRQSVYVRLRPSSSDGLDLFSLIQSFCAETLKVTDREVVVHLNAPPERCTAFETALAPYRVVEAMRSAVSAFRDGIPAVMQPVTAVSQACS
ncbi:hypothetical protein R3Q08_31455 [Rhodococcus erythropolis]|uniref:hypothetical protein n=1 Tax=Rhodococcus erythropolis TaxID=1833 RepID=UPI00294A602C|nr:hypothetical protein [Rhodococcus erythropolis]MDV6212773.1 hypothetical protein [Rhodococcus erythropolis]